MIDLLRGLGGGLVTLVAGRDPAPAPMPLRHRAWAAAAVLALVGGAAMAMLYLQDTRGLPASLSAMLGLLSVLPLALVRRNPLWAWRVAWIGLFVGAWGRTADEMWPWHVVQVFAALGALFVLGLREPVWVLFWAGLSAVLAVWLMVGPANIAGVALLVTAVLVLGEQIGRRRRLQRDLIAQNQRGELLVERTRIARELHDVVAHSMSLVTVRAETAPYRLPDMNEPARAEFLALAATAREALTEMRRLLGVLRTEEQKLDLAPQPTLSDVEDLIASARAAGMRVTASLGRLSHGPSIELTVYRIVQEALSNAARHAPGAPVAVLIAMVPGEQQALIKVRNGPGPSPAAPNPAGHGLIGMRERVELLGGTLHTGQTDNGGFDVTARIPVTRR